MGRIDKCEQYETFNSRMMCMIYEHKSRGFKSIIHEEGVVLTEYCGLSNQPNGKAVLIIPGKSVKAFSINKNKLSSVHNIFSQEQLKSSNWDTAK